MSLNIKSYSKSIDEVIFLGQTLYVLLFVECYHFLSNGTSLIFNKLTFENLSIAPLFVFIITTGILRVTCHFAYVIRPQIKNRSTIPFRTLFTTYLLLITSTTYSLLLFFNPTFSPFPGHPILTSVYLGFFIFLSIVMAIFFLNQKVED